MISVIIPTLNRPTLLKDLLLNLENQVKKPNQIILVDASEPKHQINQKLFSAISIPIIYVKSDIKSAAIQRNIGLTFVPKDCEYLAFLDDDISINRDYFQIIVKHFNDEKIAGISGLAINPNTNSKILRLSLLKRLFFLDSKHEGTITPGGINIPFKTISTNSDLRKSEWLIGCSVWRYNKINDIKFNDKFLGQSLFEDVIFSLRAAKFGKLYVDCSLKLTHFESNLSRPNFSDFYQMWVFNRYFVIRLLKNKKFSRIAFHWTNFGKLIQLIFIWILNPKKNSLKLNGFFLGYLKLLRGDFLKKYEN